MFNFSLELQPGLQHDLFAGMLWMTYTFAGTLGLNRTFSAEKDENCLDGLLLAPQDRSAIFIGKVISILILMLFTEGITLIVFSILFSQNLFFPFLFIVCFLGSIGYISVGTLISSMTLQTKIRDLLLPVLLFPITLPVLIASVKATNGIISAEPITEVIPWLNLIIVYDLIFSVLGILFFENIVEG